MFCAHVLSCYVAVILKKLKRTSLKIVESFETRKVIYDLIVIADDTIRTKPIVTLDSREKDTISPCNVFGK